MAFAAIYEGSGLNRTALALQSFIERSAVHEKLTANFAASILGRQLCALRLLDLCSPGLAMRKWHHEEMTSRGKEGTTRQASSIALPAPQLFAMPPRKEIRSPASF